MFIREPIAKSATILGQTFDTFSVTVDPVELVPEVDEATLIEKITWCVRESVAASAVEASSVLLVLRDSGGTNYPLANFATPAAGVINEAFASGEFRVDFVLPPGFSLRLVHSIHGSGPTYKNVTFTAFGGVLR